MTNPTIGDDAARVELLCAKIADNGVFVSHEVMRAAIAAMPIPTPHDLLAGATPGPWECQSTQREGHDLGVSIIGANLGGLVGYALPWPTEIDSGDYSRVEANARLIAAAPDLAAENARLLARVNTLWDDRAKAYDEIATMREALRRISMLNPNNANASSADDLHFTVKAIAETALTRTKAITP